MNTPRDVLGLIVEPDPDHGGEQGGWRVIDGGGEVLGRGTLPRCDRLRLEHLRSGVGVGRPNMKFPTLGGKQLWGDVFVSCGWRIQQGVFNDHHRLLNPQDRRMAWGSFEECRVAFEGERLERGLRPQSAHALVLLHGLIRAKEAMSALGATFDKAGYEVLNVNYPSTRAGIEAHADQVERLLDQTWGIDTVSFVTHSLGGIVARTLLSRCGREGGWRERARVHRLLMIFPPNQGASKAERWKSFALARAVWGPPLEELTPESAPNIPIPPCHFAIIAGARDRTVTLDEAALPGADAFRVIDAEHTFGMKHPEVVEAALRYINGGDL